MPGSQCKVDAEAGKGLSSNDFSFDEKEKLEGIGAAGVFWAVPICRSAAGPGGTEVSRSLW